MGHVCISRIDGAQDMFNFLQDHHLVVKHLWIRGSGRITPQAAEILHAHFATTPLQEISLTELLFGNEMGGRLFSGLHGNPSFKEFVLSDIGDAEFSLSCGFSQREHHHQTHPP